MSYGVVAINPKFRSNVGAILRVCSAFDAQFFYWSGERAKAELSPKGKIRLPREERMEEYSKVKFRNHAEPLLPFAFTPVAVEFGEYESLYDFEHPELATYVFGAEDKGIPQSVLRKCHRFVTIPTNHCLNLATAVSIVLYDRKVKDAHR